MKTLIRPLILIMLVSFFLGVYYQLIVREDQRPLLLDLQRAPLTILTRHPKIWQDLTQSISSPNEPLIIETLNAPLAEYPEALKHCDFVEVRSDTLPGMIETLQLGSTLSAELKSRLNLVHADFFAGPFYGLNTPAIPILWGAYQWFARAPKTAGPPPKWESAWMASSPSRPVYLGADPDALLAQMLGSEMSPPMDIEIDGPDLESGNHLLPKSTDEAQKWFDSWKGKIAWAFGLSGNAAEVKANMESIDLAYLRVEDAPGWHQLIPITPPQLVIWGLAPCHKLEIHPDALRFIDELGRGEHQVQVLERWNLSSTLNASSHWSESSTKWSARGIRHLSLSNLMWRSLSWNALLVWDRLQRPTGGQK